MRILYYNWVDYLDDEGRGGGVSLYQRHLMEALDARPGVEARFLSSGISYDLIARRPRWERVRHGPGKDRGRRYEIVNSGVLSPGHHSFGNPGQIDHGPTLETFLDFVKRTGPYDVIHFNNLEGLPARVLELKRRWPRTRVILSLHNYYPFCPQVNLWWREREACNDFEGGRRCVDCLPSKPDERVVRLANALAFRLKKAGVRPGTRRFDDVFRSIMRAAWRLLRPLHRLRPRPGVLTGKACPTDGRSFAERRKEMTRLINEECDRVLCVSERVRAIAAMHGIEKRRLRVSYIGTPQAERFRETGPRPNLLRKDGTLMLGYLGYMRRDKGFFFLLDALERLPRDLASRLRVTIAARSGGSDAMRRLGALAGRLKEVRHVDGYAHGHLDELLSEVDLGVVPVLWEDNLPQVAIEMHARHVPLLVSDMGGASELSRCPEMIFRAGDVESLHTRLRHVMEGRVHLSEYWQGARPPIRMDDHCTDLYELYAEPTRALVSVFRG